MIGIALVTGLAVILSLNAAVMSVLPVEPKLRHAALVAANVCGAIGLWMVAVLATLGNIVAQ